MATQDFNGLIKCQGNLEELLHPTKKVADADKVRAFLCVHIPTV
jgi:hypothetical protein